MNMNIKEGRTGSELFFINFFSYFPEVIDETMNILYRAR